MSISFHKLLKHAAAFSLLLLVCGISFIHAAPEITCDDLIYDFGKVKNNKPIKHTFIIRNSGNAPLKIGRVRACCGGKAKIGANSIAPGTNTTFMISLSLVGRKGELNKSFYIASNDPKCPYYQLKLRGMVIPTVDVNPRYINFGQVSDDSILTTNINILCLSDFAFNITNIISTVKQFSVEYEKSNNNTKHAITVKSVPPFPPGITRGNIYIFTDRSGYKRINVPVLARVSSDILVVPQEVLLKEPQGDIKPVTRYIAIRSRSKTPFKILQVKPPEPEMEIKITPLGRAGYRCEIRNIMPFSDLDEKHIIITTDHKDAGEIKLPVRVK
ncbi:DUF1573 domain-containing protein [Verrucomicrobiota bacterium]